MTRDELSVQFEDAVDAYRVDPSCDNAAVLRTMVGEYLKAQGYGLPAIGPTLAIMEVLNEQHSHDANWFINIGCWWMRRALKPERPGWNDYWMLRWRLTGDQTCAREIHRRVAHLTEWPMVQETAQWMASSVAQQRPDFAQAMLYAERSCEHCGGHA